LHHSQSRECSPQREKIDRCIREFCTVDDQEAAERLVRTQLELVAESHALLIAVPFDQADYSAAYDALRWVSHATNVRYPGVFGASTWLPQFMTRDFGLAFYALAHLYER
jgi:hypothetical protein